jgi:PAS domain S-box-containing protein
MTLRNKASLLIGIIIALSIGISGIFYLRFLENSLRNSIFKGLESINQTSSKVISRFLGDTLREAKAIATTLPETALAEKHTAVIEEKLKSLLDIFPKFENGLFILDQNGKLWVDYPRHPSVRGKSFAYRQYFKMTMQEHRGIIGSPYRSARTGKPVLTFTALLKNSQGRLLGLLGCSVQLTSPNALEGIRLTRIGESGYIYVYDTTRLMILHPKDKRVLERDVPPGANKLFDAAIDGFEGVGETVNSRGIPMLLSLKRIPGTDWILGAQQPQREALAPIRNARKTIIYCIFAAVLIAVIIGALAIRGVTQPLQRLREAVMLFDVEDYTTKNSGVDKTELYKKIESINGEGEIADLAKTFKEILERLDRTVVSLKGSARDWERTFDSVSEAIFLLDRNNIIIRLNQSAAEQLNVDYSGAIGRQFEDLVEKADIYSEFYSDLHKEAPEKTDLVRLKRSATARICEMTQTPVYNEAGDAIGTVRVLKDITSRLQAEEDKKRLEAQLKQAQKMEAVGTLAGGIAHDFNNILSAVIGYTEIALEDVTENTLLKKNLKEVLKAGERARELVNQILAFSRHSEETLKPLKVKIILKEALKLLRASLPSTIEIVQNIESEACVLASPTQIHQILMNLCTNAGHAMQERGGSLDVSLTDVELDSRFTSQNPGASPGPYLKLTVRDTGHGIPPEVQDRIFDPFFTTKGIGEGTGMGLAVVHGIITNYGGIIQIESQAGKGTTFDIFIPIIEKETDIQAAEQSSVPHGSERILFVDDEEIMVDVGRQMLERLGYRVTVKSSSVEALSLFKARQDEFDLVITDMTMPILTGDRLAVKLMAIRPDIPVILCTGYSAQVSEEKAKSLGIKAFVMKPLVRISLANTIRRVLDENQGLEPAA